MLNKSCANLQDVQSCIKGKGFCIAHGKSCGMPSKHPELVVAGFACKSNSIMNSERFRADALAEEKQSQMTFNSALLLLEKTTPKLFLLENVLGASKSLGSTTRFRRNDVAK